MKRPLIALNSLRQTLRVCQLPRRRTPSVCSLRSHPAPSRRELPLSRLRRQLPKGSKSVAVRRFLSPWERWHRKAMTEWEAPSQRGLASPTAMTGGVSPRGRGMRVERADGGSPQKETATLSWVFVKQFSRNDTATACQDWLRVPG